MGDERMPTGGPLPRGAPAEQEQAYVEAALEHTRRHFMFVTLVYRLLIVVAAALVVPLVVVIGDQLAPGGLPRALVFGAGLVWMIASIACLLGVSTRTMMRRLNRLFVARYVERRNNLAHNPLVNALLLSEDRRATHARQAAARDAATVLHNTADPAAPVSMRHAALLLAGAAALWVGFALVTPKPILPSLQRLFGVRRAAPTATTLELLAPRPDRPVYAGEPLRIELAVSGRPAEKVTFAQFPADAAAPALTSEMKPGIAEGPRRHYALLLAGYEVSRDFRYRITAGDAVLEGRIDVRPRADVRRLEIALTPPEYIGAAPRRTTDPDLHVWSGTRATFDVHANTPIADPVFVLRGESETRTRMRVTADDPRHATLTTTLTRSGDYWIEFADRDGRPGVDPAVHRLIVRTDRAPALEIVAPSRDEAPDDVADVTHVAQIRIRATDDVRLGAVEMVWDAGGKTTRRSLLAGTTDAPRQTSVELELATSELPIEPGQSATVWFEARDNRVLPDGRAAPQIATTRKLRLIRSTPQVARADDPGIRPGNPADTTTEVAEPGARVVRRSPTDDAGENGQSVTASKRGDPTGGLYKPASGKGEATGDEDGPTIVDPNQVGDEPGGSTGDGDPSGPGAASDDPHAAAQDGAAAEDFKQKLRKFIEEHGDEARQVRAELGDAERPEDSAERQKRAGGGGGGGAPGGAGDGPSEDQPTPPGSDTAGADQPDPTPTPARSDPQAEPKPEHNAGVPSADGGDSAPGSDDAGDAREPAQSPPAQQSPPSQPQDNPGADRGSSEPTRTGETPRNADHDPGGAPSAGAQAGSNQQTGQDSEPEEKAGDASDTQPSGRDASPRKPANESATRSDTPSKQKQSAKSDSQDSRRSDDGDRASPADDQSAQQPAAGNQSRQAPPAAGNQSEPAPPAGEAAGEAAETPDGQDTTAGKPDSAAGADREQPGANPLKGASGAGEDARVIPMGPAREPVAAPDSPRAGQREPGEGDLATEGRNDLVDTLELLERAEELTEEDLDATGWPPARRQAFIRDLKRLHESARRAGVLAQLKTWAAGGRLGSAEVSAGTGLAGGLSLGVGRRASVRDRIAQIAPPPQQRIAPELRAVLDAYYRALAAKRREPARPSAKKTSGAPTAP